MVDTTARTAAASVTSPWNPWTSAPAAASAGIRCDPRNPRAPVTSTRRPARWMLSWVGRPDIRNRGVVGGAAIDFTRIVRQRGAVRHERRRPAKRRKTGPRAGRDRDQPIVALTRFDLHHPAAGG